MKLNKAYSRDKRRFKKQHGMRTSGRSVFTIQQAQVKRATISKKESV